MPAVYVYRRYVRDAIEERVGKKKRKEKEEYMKNKEVTSYRKETTTVIGIGFKSFTICSTIALNRPLPSTMNKQTSAMVKSNGPTVVIPIRILEGMGGRERKTTWSGPPYCLPPHTHTPNPRPWVK